MSKINGSYVHAPHKPDPARLAEVLAEMRSLGAPTIRAYWTGDYWLALEGSHRIAAARELGLTPVLDALSLDDVVEHDFEDVEDRRVPVSRLVEHLAELGPDYYFEEIPRG